MRISDWSSDVCSSDLERKGIMAKLSLSVQFAHQPAEASGEQMPSVAQFRTWARSALAVEAEITLRSVDEPEGRTLRSEEQRVGRECARPWTARESTNPSTKTKQHPHKKNKRTK